MRIPFNRPFVTGQELARVAEAQGNGMLAGAGPFTKVCETWLERRTGCRRALLTHSCTAALEMAAILVDIAPGDEVIMPSFTFVSTANAFVLRGGIPVFVDVRPDTLNIDESLIEAAITPRTRVIVAVHYAGVGCEMGVIGNLARRHGLLVIEDAAQALMTTLHGRPLGNFGDLAALSFHETKNIISGEGGALLINNPTYVERAEIIRDKGTNRGAFFRGEIDKYTWVDIGSSFLPGEVVAAFLSAQMDAAEEITSRRLELWQRYHAALEPLESAGRLRRPIVPAECSHNGHIYYILLRSLEERSRVISACADRSISAIFHYQPLHSAPAGRRHARSHGSLVVTERIADTLLRLPLFIGLDDGVDEVVAAVADGLERTNS